MLATALVAVVFAGLHVLQRLPGVPYNVRELFGTEHRTASMLVFSATAVWLGFAPAWIGESLARRPRLLGLLPIWTALTGLVSWFLVQFAVTLESLKDIVGSETLGWAGDWEHIGRFVALQATPTLMLMAGSMWIGSVRRHGSRTGSRLGASAFGWSVPWLVLAWAVAVRWASTDNLTELLRREPVWFVGPLCLTALAAVVGINAAALGRALAGRRLRAIVVWGLLTPAAGTATWGLLYLGLDPAVEKYGLTFPAIRFLLGPDRAQPLGAWALFARWLAVHVASVLLLSLSTTIAVWLSPAVPRSMGRSAPAGQAPPASDATLRRLGRAYAVATAVYAVFLLYGSLLPFDLLARSLNEAWEVFVRQVQPAATRWSQSDVVTNIAMMVPLTFCALGAWSRAGTRRLGWFALPSVFTAGLALSIGLEFVQVFAIGRVVSGHDLIAQTIGNALGLGAWAVSGPSLSAWAAGLSADARIAYRGTRLLAIYAAFMTLVELLPLNPTISLTQIYRRYRRGLINVIPFADWGGYDLHAVVMQIAMYVPVGCLAALWARRTRRPLTWTVLGGTAFAALLETAQVFVNSRDVIASSTDVALAAVGVVLGGLLLRWLGAAEDRERHGRWVLLALALIWTAAIVSKAWSPFHTQRPDAGTVAALGDVLRTAPFAIVGRLGPLDGLRRLGRDFLGFMVLGMLLQGLVGGGRGARLTAVAATAAVAVMIELGRLFFSRYAPDTTLAATGVAGALASLWLYPQLVKLVLPAAERRAAPPADTMRGARECLDDDTSYRHD